MNQLKQFKGEVEVNESYFGPRRMRGMATKRGRGIHRQPVFGIYERPGRVYTEIIPAVSERPCTASFLKKWRSLHHLLRLLERL